MKKRIKSGYSVMPSRLNTDIVENFLRWQNVNTRTTYATCVVPNIEKVSTYFNLLKKTHVAKYINKLI